MSRQPTPAELELARAAATRGFDTAFGDAPDTYILAADDCVQYIGSLRECSRFVRKAHAVALGPKPVA